MAAHTISTLPRISSCDLGSLILETASPDLSKQTPPAKLAIIDVRDEDHIGGHIKHSTHVPSRSLDHQIPSLVRKLADKEVVVFHCALSQQRGPSAALRYLRERERLKGFSSTAVGEALKKNKEESEGGETTEEGKTDGEWEDVVEEKKEQKVYVLEKGFVGWQEEYGEDSRLTEGYRKEIWKDGYQY